MRIPDLALCCLSLPALAQTTPVSTTQASNDTENIYSIKKDFLYNVLHNPTEIEQKTIMNYCVSTGGFMM
jgi:hypothetical protein